MESIVVTRLRSMTGNMLVEFLKAYRSVVVVKHGRTYGPTTDIAVLVNVDDYKAMVERLEFLEKTKEDS